MTTWGSISGRNEFKIKGGQIEGKVNGVVSDDAKTITWSHGYTAYLESPRPIDLEGVWQVYSVAEDGKSAQATEQCSVEQRKHDGKTSVHSFCEQSGYHEWMLDEEAKTMKNGEEKWAVSPCSGVVYSKEKGVFATKLGASSKAKATATKDPVSRRLSKIGKAAAIGPAWVHGDMEKPEGEKDMGTWQALVYTPEQQERLGVDEFGVPTSTKDVDEMAKLPLLAPGLMIPKKTLRGGK